MPSRNVTYVQKEWASPCLQFKMGENVGQTMQEHMESMDHQKNVVMEKEGIMQMMSTISLVSGGI